MKDSSITQSAKKPSGPSSPRWNNSTKLVVAAFFLVVAVGLLIVFRNILGPLLLAFVMVYLFYPVADMLHTRFQLNWRLSVALVYLLLIVVIGGGLVWGGFAIVDQSQSMFGFLAKQMDSLPDFLTDLGKTNYSFGPFTFNFEQLDTQIDQLITDLMDSLTSVASQAGLLVGSFASGAANLIANTVLVLLVSFFMLSESNGVASQIVNLNVPRYQMDIQHMTRRLSRIWDGFLRGQLTLILITVLLYTLVLTILGMPYAIGLALLAGLARFLPYIGPGILWVVLFLVSIFQSEPGWGLLPIWYAVLVVGVGMVVDVVIDQFITPKLMGRALHMHPAALLVGVFMGASLLGFIGIILAAPVLATLKVFAQYAFRKLFDLDPWEVPEEKHDVPDPKVRRKWRRLEAAWERLPKKLKGKKSDV